MSGRKLLDPTTYVADRPSWRDSPSPPVVEDFEASRSYSDTPHSIGLLWTSHQQDAETSIYPHTTLTTSMPPAGFGPAVPANERPQTHILERAATAIGKMSVTTTAFGHISPELWGVGGGDIAWTDLPQHTVKSFHS